MTSTKESSLEEAVLFLKQVLWAEIKSLTAFTGRCDYACVYVRVRANMQNPKGCSCCETENKIAFLEIYLWFLLNNMKPVHLKMNYSYVL